MHFTTRITTHLSRVVALCLHLRGRRRLFGIKCPFDSMAVVSLVFIANGRTASSSLPDDDGDLITRPQSDTTTSPQWRLYLSNSLPGKHRGTTVQLLLAGGACWAYDSNFVYCSTWPQEVKTHTQTVSRERHVYINKWRPGNSSQQKQQPPRRPTPNHPPPIACRKQEWGYL